MKGLVLCAVALLSIAAPTHARAQNSGSPARTEVIHSPNARRAEATLGIGLMLKRPFMSPEGRVRYAEYPLVTEVARGGPAEKVGIRADDVIVSANGTDAREQRALLPTRAGERFVLRVRRGTEVREFTVVAVATPQPSRR